VTSNRLLIPILAGALAVLIPTGCSRSDKTCEDLAARLCAAHPDRCAQARPWIEDQGGSLTPGASVEAHKAAQDSCARALATEDAFTAYARRFSDATAPKPAGTARTPATRAPAPGAPSDPTTRDNVKTAGEVAEEVGKTGEKVGEALERIEDAFKRTDTRP